MQSFEVASLCTGSVVLYSHNTFHRGNHRRDDWRTWEDNPRFMYYRPGAGPTARALQEVIRGDEKVICVGFAMDALSRLAHLCPEGETANDLQAEVSALLRESSVRCWESLGRSGLRPG